MGNVRHFSINADDVARARRFYERVFSWKFEAWGPPGFFMVAAGEGGGPLGSLQKRRELLPGVKTNAFECAISVEEDVEKVAESVKANGGRILMEKSTIPGVGDLIFFQDPEGNIAGAMRYDAKAE